MKVPTTFILLPIWMYSTVALDNEYYEVVSTALQNSTVASNENAGMEAASRMLYSSKGLKLASHVVRRHDDFKDRKKETHDKLTKKEKKNDNADKKTKKDKKNQQNQKLKQQSNKQKDKKKEKKTDEEKKKDKIEKKQDVLEKDKNKDDKEKKDKEAKKKSQKKPNKKEKKQEIKQNKGPNKNKVDNRATRIRKHCKTPLNPYRTCYERDIDPDNDVDEDDFILRNPFAQPFIDHDEWMVADTMHLELTQDALEKEGEVSCKDTLALEELSLKYLKDNVGGSDTFSAICAMISESAIKNEVVNDGSGRKIQTVALKLDVVFAFKRQFAQEIEETPRHGLRHLQVSRDLATCNRGNFGLCCSGKAFNSKKAKDSATCGGGSCGSSRCQKKKKKKKPSKSSRSLLHSSALPDLYQKEFDFCVGAYTVLEPDETRGVLEAKSTEDVASCAVNRFIEDVLLVPSMTCEKYRRYSCNKNEDLEPEDQTCDSNIGTVVGTGPDDCSELSKYHEFDAEIGMCIPVCPDDTNECTIDGWNDALNDCYTPVVCLDGEICDPVNGCVSTTTTTSSTTTTTTPTTATPTTPPIPAPCDDGNKCTTDAWDSSQQACIFTPIDCSTISQYHQCDPNDGTCKPNCSDDNNACTIDMWNAISNNCHTPVGLCPDGNTTCDSVSGCSCNDNNLCTVDTWNQLANTCSNNPVSCPANKSCDPADGVCKNDTMLVPCIAVIDEDNNGNNTADWLKFRTEYPDRPFCLLVPYDSYSSQHVGIPPQASSDPKFLVHNVTRDRGTLPADDWFNLCELGKLGVANVQFVGLFVDGSGSMYKSTVKNSYNKFLADIAAANLTTCEVYNSNEDWITPFITTITPNGGRCKQAVPT